MRVVLFAEELDIGGVSRHIIDLANGLHMSGIRVSVVGPDGPMRASLHSAIRFIQVEPRQGGSWGALKWTGSVRRTLQREIAGEGVILHSHKRLSDSIARTACYRTPAIHVSTCHNWFDDKRMTSHFGQWTVAVSDRLAEHLVRRYHKSPQRVRTILNGIQAVCIQDETSRQKTRKLLGIGKRNAVLVSVGHCEPRKDRGLLLRTIETFRAELSQRGAIVVIAGDGSEKTQLERYISDHDLGSLVRMIPGTYDVSSLWNIAALGVLSSKQEGLPYVILEAAALSVPHVATDVGGVSDFIRQDETGRLVPWGNPHELGNSILEMLDNEALRLRCGKGANARVVHRHGYLTFIENTMRFYQEVAGI